MSKINQMEMARTREVVASSQAEYFAALALHHARVAQVACDMHKLARITDYTPEPTPETMQCLAQMAAVIELSFVNAFGASLRPPKNKGAK